MAITLDMAMFNNIRANLTQAMIDQINRSPLFVDQLTQYNNQVINPNGTTLPFSFGAGSVMNTVAGKQQIQLDSSDPWARVSAPQIYTEPSGTQHVITREGDFVGVLAHELGHWINKDTDAARFAQLNSSQPGYLTAKSSAGLYSEGEANYNNWLVRKEILASGGQEIELRGAAYDGSGYDMFKLMSQASIASVGNSTDLIKAKMSFAGAVATSHLMTSTNSQNYYEYYKYSGQPAPVHVSAELTDYNNDGITDQIVERYTNGKVERTFLTSNIPSAISAGNGDVINAMSGSKVTVTGSNLVINATSGSDITIGGNGQNSSDAVVNLVHYYAGATVHTVDNSRTNVEIDSGNSTGGIYIGATNNIGVYGAGGPVTVHGSSTGTSNIWVGGNGTSSWISVADQLGGNITVVDNSTVSLGPGLTRTSPASVHIGSNAGVQSSAYYSTHYYLDGNHSQLSDLGTNDVIYNNGNNNVVVLKGTQVSLYNAGQYSYVNAYGANNHIFNQGSYSFVWTVTGAQNTISNTGLNNTPESNPNSLYWFWGFGGNESAIKSEFSSGATAATQLLKSISNDDSSSASVSYAIDGLKQILDLGIKSTMTGSRWAETTISWSVPDSNESHDADYRALETATKEAFDAWSHATGIKFIESKAGEVADVTIDWKDLNTDETHALGLTSFSVDNGIVQSGAKIFLEDPNVLALISGEKNTLLYKGTNATLEQVALHEIGHILGLGTNADQNSIENYFLDKNNRDISDADLEAIYSLYPELGHSPAKIIGPSWGASPDFLHAQ